MSRKTKPGIPYFSHDTDMSQDKKVKLLRAKKGLVGYAVYILLLEEIYREAGYYLEIDKDFCYLMAAEVGLDFDNFMEILNECIACLLFNSEIYKKHKILTSKRIQDNYFHSTLRRESVNLIQEYLVLAPSAYYSPNRPNVNIEPLNVNIEPLNVCDGTHSIVEYSRVENSNKDMCDSDNHFLEFWETYPNKKAKKKTLEKWTKLKVDAEMFAVIMKGLKSACKSRAWLKQNGDFVPMPTTWLNGERWNDEVKDISSKDFVCSICGGSGFVTETLSRCTCEAGINLDEEKVRTKVFIAKIEARKKTNMKKEEPKDAGNCEFT